MLLDIVSLLAAVPPTRVPDSGTTVLLLGAAIASLGLIARVIKNRKS